MFDTPTPFMFIPHVNMRTKLNGRPRPPPQKAIKATGMTPSFAHLRAICVYTEDRFVRWLGRVSPAATTATPNGDTVPQTVIKATTTSLPSLQTTHPSTTATTTAITTTATNRRGRQRPPPLSLDNPRQGSVRVDILTELGISYAVNPSKRKRLPFSAPPRSAGVGVVTTLAVGSSAMLAAAGEQETFAPGRTEARALVGQVSRGLNVLDLYCGTGSFALNAAKNGARSALGVSALTH